MKKYLIIFPAMAALSQAGEQLGLSEWTIVLAVGAVTMFIVHVCDALDEISKQLDKKD